MMTMDLSAPAIASRPPSAVQSSSSDIKQQYKHVYNLLKQFDQLKQTITTIDGIFDVRLEILRSDIVDRSTLLIYQTEYEVIGRKSREILWFKGYYDLISLAKRLWKKTDLNGIDRPEDQMINLIIEGISHFKSIIVQLEQKFKLDLRQIVDFSFLDTYEKNLYTSSAMQNQFCNGRENVHKTSAEVTKYAMETIHALLISLGDLHRYFIDFDFNMPKISKDFAANYYFEAFKLNPKTGMAHNQLGTLLAGSNYDLDSIYHYLYSLVCPVPFELSENRVALLFQSNSRYLEQIDANDKCGGNEIIGLRDFVARYILIVDVFFYDKVITDFNALCHCMLIDFRKMLQSNRIELSGDILYKMVAILFFCLAKLKTLGSNKVHHLNAFLVAMCAELIAVCTTKLEKFIGLKGSQNAKFQLRYGKHFDEFERNVRNARENHKRFVEAISSSGSQANDGNNIESENINENRYKEKIFLDKLSIESADYMTNSKLVSKGSDDLAACSSGRERESDAGKLSASSQTKHKKKQTHLRRRRRRLASDNSNSDLSYFEDSASEYEMDTDFSSGNESAEENADDSWDTSDNDDEDDVDKPYESKGDGENHSQEHQPCENESIAKHVESNGGKIKQNSDSDDIIIEEEEIVFLNDNKNGNDGISPTLNVKERCEESIFDGFMSGLSKLNICADDTDDIIIEGEKFMFNSFHDPNQNKSKSTSETNLESICNGQVKDNCAPEKLRYKQKYNKIDPNIIIEFAEYENTMKALKLLFDWLRINSEILVNCFTTNPEFIDKIFALLNYMNIDIFTRKVYFERRHIDRDDVRENLRSLFDIRTTIPLNEDVLLKEFSVFDQCQHNIDWTLPLKLNITEKEENILRIFSFIDFGFSLCKMKKFNYNFCSRSRNFIQLANEKRSSNKRMRKRGRRNKRRHRRFNGNYFDGEFPRIMNHTNTNTNNTSNDDADPIDEVEGKKVGLKKGYLKNRQNHSNGTISNSNTDLTNKGTSASPTGKHELMGKLWLQHEIEVLEKKMSKNRMIPTPYLVVDTKALTNQLDVVKNLVKAKKFVVLIPNAVLSELDDLKKTSEMARNSIRWMEREFTKGSRFVRLQRNNETKPLSLIKVPKKLDRESSTFVQIAHFCNFMNETHSVSNTTIIDDASHNAVAAARPNVVTFLTGDKLTDKKMTNISFTGIMNAMGINFEQINAFYAKYKNK